MENELINILTQTKFGLIFVICIAVAILVLVVLDKAFNVFSGAADRREKRKKNALDKALEDKQFRENIEKMVVEVPKLSKQISDITNEIGVYINKETSLEQSQQSALDKIDEIQKNIFELKKSSDDQDAEISEHLQSTVNAVSEMQESIMDVSNKVNLIIDSDIDEFRIYLMNCYNKYVINKEKLTRQEKQVLKTKFKRYKSEGGNGWAQSLMDEINEVYAESDISSNITMHDEEE